MKKRFSLILIIIISILCQGCSNRAPLSKSDFLLDTVISVTLYDSDSNTILDNTFKICKKYENLFSKTIKNSDVSKINTSKGSWVSVSSDTIEIISKSLYYSEISDGVFDVTIGSVTELWDFKSESPTPPAEEKIREALKHVNYQNVEIDYDNNRVRLLDPDAKIDLGGIAKGYIADKIKAYLIENKIESAVINLGGNVLTLGSKNNNEPFNIGIRKPFGDANELYSSVLVGDNKPYSSVVSSGAYERNYTYNGKLYHHIIDPRTGYPSNSLLSGVTILTKSSVDGDALSTICFILGEKEGQELINSQPETSALFY